MEQNIQQDLSNPVIARFLPEQVISQADFPQISELLWLGPANLQFLERQVCVQIHAQAEQIKHYRQAIQALAQLDSSLVKTYLTAMQDCGKCFCLRGRGDQPMTLAESHMARMFIPHCIFGERFYEERTLGGPILQDQIFALCGNNVLQELQTDTNHASEDDLAQIFYQDSEGELRPCPMLDYGPDLVDQIIEQWRNLIANCYTMQKRLEKYEELLTAGMGQATEYRPLMPNFREEAHFEVGQTVLYAEDLVAGELILTPSEVKTADFARHSVTLTSAAGSVTTSWFSPFILNVEEAEFFCQTDHADYLVEWLLAGDVGDSTTKTKVGD